MKMIKKMEMGMGDDQNKNLQSVESQLYTFVILS